MLGEVDALAEHKVLEQVVECFEDVRNGRGKDIDEVGVTNPMVFRIWVKSRYHSRSRVLQSSYL